MALLKFELKKLLASKRLIFTITIIILGILFLIIRNYSLQSYVEREEVIEVESYLEVIYNEIQQYEYVLRLQPDDEDTINLLNESRLLRDTLIDWRSALNEEDWELPLQLENQFLNQLKFYTEIGGISPISLKQIEKELLFNHYLLDHHIKPEHDQYSLSFPIFFSQTIKLFTNIGAYILLLLVIGDLVTSEYERNSIRLLLTQPINRHKLMFAKYSVAMILYFSMLIITIISTYILGKLFGKSGTFQYPVMIEYKGNFSFITINQYIGQSIILTTFMISVILALIIFYSIIFKNTILMTVALLVTTMIGFIFIDHHDISIISYLNPLQTLIPENSITYQNVMLWYDTIPVQIIFTITLLLLSILILRRTRIGS